MRSKVIERILAKTPAEVTIFVNLYAALVVRVNSILKEKGLTQKALAEKLDKKPSEIHKWLSGEHNFTLRSLAKLSAELGEPLLEVPKRKTQTAFIEDGFICKMHSFVSYTKKETNTTGKIWQLPVEADQIKELSNVG